MNIFEGLMWSSSSVSITTLLLNLVVALVLGQMIAWVYSWTHRGVSYARNFVQSLILSCLVVTMVMSVIGTNLVAAFGLLGALSIIRFRTPIRDARDTAFIFLALVCGMATGMGFLSVAAVGTGAVCMVAVYLHLTDFGARRMFEGLLQVQAAVDASWTASAEKVLKQFCYASELMSVRLLPTYDAVGTTLYDYAYQVRLRNADESAQMVAALQEIEGVDRVNLHLQESNETM